jgi:hypothetical protein
VSNNDERVEVVNEFMYLGRVFEKSGSMDGEINGRVCAGRKVVSTMAKLAKIIVCHIRQSLLSTMLSYYLPYCMVPNLICMSGKA